MSYEPPVSVKDQPHRILDTSDALLETIEINSNDFGSISIVGNSAGIESQDADYRLDTRKVAGYGVLR